MKKKILILITLFVLCMSNAYAYPADVTVTVKNEISGESEIISEYNGLNTIADLISYISGLSKFSSYDDYVMVMVDNNHILVENTTVIGTLGSSVTLKAFKQGDSTNMKYTLNSVKPTNDEEMLYLSSNYVNSNPSADIILVDTCNSDYSVCSAYDPHSYTYFKDVEINYVYDSDIKNKIDTLLTTEPADNYYITDMYSVAFYADGNTLGQSNSKISLYSKDFAEYVNYANLRINIGQFMGGSDPFGETNSGYIALKYNETIYKMFSNKNFALYNVIYVSDSTSESDYVSAIQSRLESSFSGVNFTVTDLGDATVAASVIGVSQSAINNARTNIETKTNSTLYDHVYKITIDDTDTYFFVSKDSSKITSKSFKSIDAITNISVDTEALISNEVSIVVNNVSSEEKTRLFKILNITDGESFDIKLKYDDSDTYVTTLSNGQFLVKIPVPTKYNGKELIVYYVSNDNTIEEHKVTVALGYATFVTNHFSIYTLTTSPVNPNTSDNVYLSYVLLIITTIALSIIVINKKRFN